MSCMHRHFRKFHNMYAGSQHIMYSQNLKLENIYVWQRIFRVFESALKYDENPSTRMKTAQLFILINRV